MPLNWFKLHQTVISSLITFYDSFVEVGDIISLYLTEDYIKQKSFEQIVPNQYLTFGGEIHFLAEMVTNKNNYFGFE